jgi:ribosomal protein S18 acetylase RimI-like enzyme
MHIRSGTEHETALVRELGNKMLAHHASFDSFYKPVTADDAHTTSAEKVIFVATDDDGVAFGYIQGVFFKEPQDRSYPFAVIQSVWVEEIARGRGVAKSLVAVFEEAVKKKGARQVDMLVDLKNNLGLALWDAAGYEIYQEKRRKLL